MPPDQPYEWKRHGDLIHIEIKKLARFLKVRKRNAGNQQQGRSAVIGYDRVDVALEDTTWQVYVVVLADQHQARVSTVVMR